MARAANGYEEWVLETACGAVTLATQRSGADADPVLPPQASERVYAPAREPRRIGRLADPAHTLDEAAATVHGLVHDRITERLGTAAYAAGETFR